MGNCNSTGKSGEFFVAAELERRGFTVALTYANSKDYDILAVSRETNKQFAIQVKTCKSRKNRWLMSKKSEQLIGNRTFFVFVSLCGLDIPEYHIVPCKKVVDYIKKEHDEWIKKPSKIGEKHTENSIRVFIDEGNKYKNNWKILK